MVRRNTIHINSTDSNFTNFKNKVTISLNLAKKCQDVNISHFEVEIASRTFYKHTWRLQT